MGWECAGVWGDVGWECAGVWGGSVQVCGVGVCRCVG